MSKFTRNFLEEDGQPLVGVTSCLCYTLWGQDTAIAVSLYTDSKGLLISNRVTDSYDDPVSQPSP